MDFAALPAILQSLAVIILLASVPGAAGGLVAHFINNERVPQAPARRGDQPSAISEPVRFASPFQSMFIGAAGGVAFIFFVSAVSATFDLRTGLEMAKFVSISLIAGFGARRLLPMMVGQLEKQIAHAEQSADKALSTAQDLLSQLKAAQQRMSNTEATMQLTQGKLEATARKLELLRINANLLSAAHPSAPKSTRERAMAEATAALAEIGDVADHDESLPAIYINLARLQRASGDLDEAIELLKRFVSKAERGELVANANVSVAYYNLACYRILKHEREIGDAELDQAMSDFERSVNLSPTPADDLRYAREDADLSPLKETKRFKDLLKRFVDDQPDGPTA